MKIGWLLFDDDDEEEPQVTFHRTEPDPWRGGIKVRIVYTEVEEDTE